MNRSEAKKALGQQALTDFTERLTSSVERPLPTTKRPPRESVSRPALFGDKAQELGRFFQFTRNARARREAQGRERWDLTEWQAFVKFGRAAFGPTDDALWGDLRRIEIMLDNDLTAEQIDFELAEIRARRDRVDRERDERYKRESDASSARSRQLALEAELQKETIKAEAKRLAAERVAGGSGRRRMPT